jgi:hypothetical protein
VLLAVGTDALAANYEGLLPVDSAVSRRRSAVTKYLLQHFYATTHRLPLHELLEDLTWIGSPNTMEVFVPPLCKVLRRNVFGMDAVVEILLEFLVDQNPELLSSRDQDGSLHSTLPVDVALLSLLFNLW